MMDSLRQKNVPRISGPLPLLKQFGCDFCNVLALEARCIKLVFTRQPFAVAPGDRRSPIGRTPRHLVDPHLPRKGIRKADDDHAMVQKGDMKGKNSRFLPSMLGCAGGENASHFADKGT